MTILNPPLITFFNKSQLKPAQSNYLHSSKANVSVIIRCNFEARFEMPAHFPMTAFNFTTAIATFCKVRPFAFQNYSPLFIVTDSRTPSVKRVMKVVPRENSESGTANEPLICKMLHHPSVLPLPKHFRGTLSQAVLNEKYIRPESAARTMRQMLNAVAYLHSIYIMHGDISPNNVMFENDNPILIDFGTAELLSDNDVSTCVIGTVPYVAPERRKRQSAFASDIYSLGMTFAFLTGHSVWAVAANRYAAVEVFRGHPCEGWLSDLLYGMTRANAKARYSLKTCLNHQFWEMIEENVVNDSRRDIWREWIKNGQISSESSHGSDTVVMLNKLSIFDNLCEL
jgi:serine/threonine protein kinase